MVAGFSKKICNFFLKKKKKLYGPFLWMGFNRLKAGATSRRQFEQVYCKTRQNSYFYTSNYLTVINVKTVLILYWLLIVTFNLEL